MQLDIMAKTMNESGELKKLFSICNSNLLKTKECIEYLNSRNLNKEHICKFNIGYFPQNINMLSKFMNKDLMMRLNIFDFSGSSFSDYHSLIFPIYDEYNNAVGLSGRTLMSEDARSSLGVPKYKNSSYKKSNILYGLNNSRSSILKKNNVYIVEGYFDYMSMVNNGFLNCVAICGTSFSSNHFVKLARYTNKITFLLDSDDAGVKSSERIFAKFSNKGIKLRFLKICGGYKDIDEVFLDNHSADTLKEVLKPVVPGVW